MKLPDPDKILRSALTEALPFIDSRHILDDAICFLTTGEWVDSWRRDNVKYYYTELDMTVRTAMMYHYRWLKRESAPNARYARTVLISSCLKIRRLLEAVESCRKDSIRGLPSFR